VRGDFQSSNPIFAFEAINAKTLVVLPCQLVVGFFFANLKRKESISGMTKIQGVNLALRALMELGIVIALAVWGYQMGEGLSMKILLGIMVPVLGFGFWGAVDFHQAGRFAEPLRLFEELIISGLAAIAFYVAGQHALGWILGLLSIVYHLLVYLSGEHLLKQS
jgi:hypothetical protein